MKDQDPYEIHEKARKRIQQKKRLYFHFILFVIGSISMFILNKVVLFKSEHDWYVWITLVWTFFLISHFINVFFMNQFFGKEWVQIETEKLISKHRSKVEALEKSLEKKGAFNSDNSEEEINS